MRIIPSLDEYVENFRRRVMQDALAEATSRYWNRRADAFEDALPRAGDFTGEATAEDLDEQRVRLTAMVAACRQRASVALLQDQRGPAVCPLCDTPVSPWSCSCGATRVGEVA